ncbi:hypothetical protein CF327_g867 [Tilletia walkeri]|nr:hypothetical protein CF327_g867 [Tilletia walkeri]
MCIFFFTLDHPTYCLIAASNRDEFLARPTQDAEWHSFGDESRPNNSSPSVLSGVDASGGGTWLGISHSGRFGSLLNFTERPPPPPAPELGIDKYLSRGELVRRWLVGHDAEEGPAHISGDQGLEAYLESVHQKRDFFPGFNLLVGQVVEDESDPETKSFRLGYVSNRTEGGDKPPLILEADSQGMNDGVCAVCGLSNSVYLEPWPKVQEGKGLLKTALEEWDAEAHTGSAGKDQDVTEEKEDLLIEKLFTILGTNSDPDVPAPQPSNIRATIQVPPLQLPIPKSNQRTGGGAGPNAGTSVLIPSKTDTTTQSTPGPSSASGPDSAAEAIRAAVAAGAELGWYGSRLSTVVLVRRKGGQATFVERDVFQLGEDGKVGRAEEKGRKGERRFRWTLG